MPKSRCGRSRQSGFSRSVAPASRLAKPPPRTPYSFHLHHHHAGFRFWQAFAQDHGRLAGGFFVRT